MSHFLQPHVCACKLIARMCPQMLCCNNASTSWIGIQYSLEVIPYPCILCLLISLDHTLSNFPCSVGHVNGHFYSMFILQIGYYGMYWCVYVCPQLFLTLMCQPSCSHFGALSYSSTIVVQVHLLYTKSFLMCYLRSINEKRTVLCTANCNNSI